MKAQARVQDSAMSRQKNVLPEVYNLYKLDDMNIVRQELNLSVHHNQSVSWFQFCSQPACQWVIRQISQPDSRLEGQSAVVFSQTLSQSVSQSVSQPASQSVSQLVSQSVSQAISQSVSQSVS